MSSDSNVRVSYVITTKNRATYLDKALANVREFIEPMDELIIIDGKSTDATAEVVARNRDIVTLFISEPDQGEGHAFNKALFRAKGRYIKGISDDDYFYPDAMRRLVAEMEANPDVDAIQAGGELWDRCGSTEKFIGYAFLHRSLPAATERIFDIVSGLGLIVRYPHSGMMVSRDKMERDRLVFFLRILLLSGGSSRWRTLFWGLRRASWVNRSALLGLVRRAYRTMRQLDPISSHQWSEELR